MKYRGFIEKYFLIDEPQAGKLVPFIFNPVQARYYDQLVQDYDIEKKGIAAAVREDILKARREGFSSLILALFCADDITQTNPTESLVVSYKDEATKTFRKRYRRYALSYYARKAGHTIEQIQANPNILEAGAKAFLSIDSSEIEFAHNKAHFYCGTASARTGGRGGVLQKCLYSEAAHYPDTENMTAKEIIEGTSQQVDKASGWVFMESTANGVGNYYHQTWELATKGLSRYKPRFYGWREFYSPEQFAVIKSEFTDPDMLKQEYPETPEEAFLTSGTPFTTPDLLKAMVGVDAAKELLPPVEFRGTNYIDQAETIKDYLVTLEKTDPHHAFYVGLDTAKSIDATTLYILRKQELTASGGVKGLAIDATGQGDFMPDWFERNTRWYVHRVKFSRPSKSILYKNLQTVIASRLTTLPQYILPDQKTFTSPELRNFFRQMTFLKKEIIGDMIVVAHPPGNCAAVHDYDNCPHHDDHPDSWALAELVYTVLLGAPASRKPPAKQSNISEATARMLSARAKIRDSSNDDYV